MSTLPRLKKLFTHLGTLAPLLASPGCGIDEEQFSFDACTEEHEYTFIGSVKPATPVEYLELRQWEDFELEAEENTVRILEASGTICDGADDPQACMDAFAALPVEPGFSSVSDIIRYNSLAYTRGDEVASVATLSALSAFLGSIDSPGDAALFGILTEHSLNCSSGDEVGEHPEGYVLYTRTGNGCGESDVESHVVLIRADGTSEILETELVDRADPNCAIGRLPGGLCRRSTPQGSTPVAAFLADVAHLEAAAIPAFGQLAHELALHQAPRSLIREALRGRDDEVRHARLTAHLARRRGGRPQRPRVVATAPRSLLALAEDNAIEGCVRETYGALVAHVQGRRARDPELRRAFAAIARDETRHAALSWDIHRWARARLSPTAKRRLARRQARALERLRVELTGAFDPSVHRATGLPEPAQARALFDHLQRSFASERA